MSTGKRKISIRKVIQTLVTFILVAGFTVAVLSADRSQSRKKLEHVYISVRNANQVHFVDEEEVTKMLFDNRHIDPYEISLSQLDVNRMENIARSNPWISDAQIYVDNERNLHVSVTQRIPVVRVFEENGTSYYMDRELKSIPLSDRYVYYAPMVTGAPSMRDDDSISRDYKGTMLSVVDHITKNKFWSAQIAQIVINRDKTFELIPILGKQRILLGDTSRIPEKLSNLLSFYQQVENKIGWEKYEVIDLRFKDQVIASPALSWKIPVDRALTNMNWVKAVMESASKEEKDESVSNALDTGMMGGRVATDVIPAPASNASPRPATDNRPAPARAATVPSSQVQVSRSTNAAHGGATRPAVIPKPSTHHVTAKVPAKPTNKNVKPGAAGPKKPVSPPKKGDKKAVSPKPKPRPLTAGKKPAGNSKKPVRQITPLKKPAHH